MLLGGEGTVASVGGGGGGGCCIGGVVVTLMADSVSLLVA